MLLHNVRLQGYSGLPGPVVGAKHVFVGEADIYSEPHDRCTGASNEDRFSKSW